MAEPSRSLARAADYRFFAAPSTGVLLRGLGVARIGDRAVRELQRRLQPA